jgi:uncharacterized protein YjiS (DUF1127 family)
MTARVVHLHETGLLTGLVKRLAKAVADWRARQIAMEELSALDDHMLADIGICRGEIPGVVSGAIQPRRASNENRQAA